MVKVVASVALLLANVSAWDLPDDCRNQTVVEEGGVMPTMSYHVHYVTDNRAVYGDMKTFYEDFIAAFSEHFLSTTRCPFGPNYGAYNSDIFPSKTICSLEGPVNIKYDCGIVVDATGCDIDQPSSGQCMAKLPDTCLPGEHCNANGKDPQCAWCVYDMAQCKSLYGNECEYGRHCHDPHRVQEEGGPWGGLYQRAFFVPIELIDKVWEWSKLNRLNLDVLKHPNSGCMHDDHSIRAVWEGAGHPLDLSAFPCNVPGTCCQDKDYPGPPTCGCPGGRASDAPEDSCENCVVIGDYPPQTTPNYFHFIKYGPAANFDSRTSVADGVAVYRWNGTTAGIADMQDDVCAHNVLEWDAGSVTPYPAADAWHSYDMIYFVAQGNVTITVAGETKTMKTGDTLWVQAGVTHSSLVPVDNQAGTIVDALKTPFEPQLSSPPLRFSSAAGHRFYMASEDLTPPDVTKMHHINQHDEWMGKAADPDVLHVWWRPNGQMPCHSHENGALYVTGWGKMCFSGETMEADCRTAGEARWTKPRFEYSNEVAGPEGSEIVVMNIHTNPSMCRAVV